MATTPTARPSSFSRNTSTSAASRASAPTPGSRIGAGGATFVSSGIPDLDRILGGGFLLGSLVMVMEDAEAPHHLLLLRNFMAQGVVHCQPLLFASPAEDPRAFLGTLPAPVAASKEERQRAPGPGQDEQEQGLRIAWQYKKYFGEQQASDAHNKGAFTTCMKIKLSPLLLADVKQEFGNNFDLRKSIERHMLSAQNVDCISIQKFSNLAPLRERCSSFLSKLPG
ncbi:hypothetical protein IEQ34_003724 [Dendrobium chrysotoxum]|uniref:Elongator complex protein 4 n=1 Tax=Dendrobium chrysotoxum TaxID=161865 RepID=A0AAV7HBS1_DENCH|nr:hypothetical protein IEQ34_003724 [Dendrobium chrysotoxum]